MRLMEDYIYAVFLHVKQLVATVGKKKAVVAIANRMARHQSCQYSLTAFYVEKGLCLHINEVSIFALICAY